MKKHSFTMVFLLILTLSLMGVVSASDDMSAADVDTQSSINQGEIQADVSLSEDSHDSEAPIPQDADSEISDFDETEVPTVESQDSPAGEDLKGSAHSIHSSNGGVLKSSQPIEVSDNPDDLIDEEIDCNIPVSPAGVEARSGNMEFDIENQESYKFGYDIIIAADKLFDFNCADDILVIATVGLIEIDNQTITDLNGIINASNGYVCTGKESIIALALHNTDSINIAFFIKKGESYSLALYEYGNLNPLYSGGAGPEISAGLWKTLKESFGAEDAKIFLTVINSWANGQLDDLNLATYDVSIGLENGAEILTLKNYPLKNKFDLPLENTLNGVLGASRDTYDDAFIWRENSGKQAYGAVDMVNESIAGYDLSRKSASSETLEVKALSDSSLMQIGVDAAGKALAYFESQGIDIQRDYGYFYVLTSAGYVKINGKGTDEVLGGLSKELGPKLSKNIIPMHVSSWKDLVFYFIWVNGTNDKDILSYALRYDAANGKLIVDNKVRQQGDDIAYEMGLYKKYSKYSQAHGKTAKKSTLIDIEGKYDVARHYLDAIAEAILKDAKISSSPKSSGVNNTKSDVLNSTGVENKSDDAGNVTPNSEIVNKPGIRHSDPFNIVYTIIAVLIVCAIFGVSYSKRD